MQKPALILAFLSLCTGIARAQQELAPSIDGGPLNIRSDSSASDEPATPKPDEHGVYRLTSGIVVPDLLRAMPAVGSPDDVPECSPPIVFLSAVIRIDGHAEIRRVFTPRSSACANLAIQAVKKSLYQPAKLDGHPIAVMACLSVPFMTDQPAIPTVRRCPSNSDAARLPEDDSSSGESRPSASSPTAEGLLTPLIRRGPLEVSAVTPVPDQQPKR